MKLNLIHGDSLEALPKLEESYFDVIVTSPPYNLNISYNTYKDNLNHDDYLDWCYQWASELKRVLKEDGSFFLNLGSSLKKPLVPFEILLKLTTGNDPLFVLQNTFHWIKSITLETKDGNCISTGHFKPINSQRFVNDCHEYIFHLTKNGEVSLDRKSIGVPYEDKSNIKRWNTGSDLRCRGNNWFIPYKTIVSKEKDRPHPATFPEKLVEQCIKLHGNVENLKVLDPFLGIGTSGITCKNLNVEEFTGIELDETYYKLAYDELVSD